MPGRSGTGHLPLVLANAAQSMDVEAVVVLQGNGVHLVKKGYAESITFPGLTPLKTLVDNYVANGGKFRSESPASRSARSVRLT